MNSGYTVAKLEEAVRQFCEDTSFSPEEFVDRAEQIMSELELRVMAVKEENPDLFD